MLNKLLLIVSALSFVGMARAADVADIIDDNAASFGQSQDAVSDVNSMEEVDSRSTHWYNNGRAHVRCVRFVDPAFNYCINTGCPSSHPYWNCQNKKQARRANPSIRFVGPKCWCSRDPR